MVLWASLRQESQERGKLWVQARFYVVLHGERGSIRLYYFHMAFQCVGPENIDNLLDGEADPSIM